MTDNAKNKKAENSNAANKDKVFLRQADANDVSALEQLLNLCYRQDEGWTNEADLVGGIRTTQAELAGVIANSKHYVFVYPQTDTGARGGKETGELLGCIAVDIKVETGSNKKAHSNKVYIGMFAVHPKLQGAGIGNVILQAAETFAERHLKNNNQPTRLTMSILSHRPELLAMASMRCCKALQ